MQLKQLSDAFVGPHYLQSKNVTNVKSKRNRRKPKIVALKKCQNISFATENENKKSLRGKYEYKM